MGNNSSSPCCNDVLDSKRLLLRSIDRDYSGFSFLRIDLKKPSLIFRGGEKFLPACVLCHVIKSTTVLSRVSPWFLMYGSRRRAGIPRLASPTPPCAHLSGLPC